MIKKKNIRDSPVSGHKCLMDDTFPKKITSYPRKTSKNKILTLWTYKWWGSETKHYNEIKILCSCEWLLKYYNIPLFQAEAA